MTYEIALNCDYRIICSVTAKLGLEEIEENTRQDITPLAGDVNGDGIINAVDLAQLLSEFNRQPAVFKEADIDGNGIVNATDLTYLLAGFNKRSIVKE